MIWETENKEEDEEEEKDREKNEKEELLKIPIKTCEQNSGINPWAFDFDRNGP